MLEEKTDSTWWAMKDEEIFVRRGDWPDFEVEVCAAKAPRDRPILPPLAAMIAGNWGQPYQPPFWVEIRAKCAVRVIDELPAADADEAVAGELGGY